MKRFTLLFVALLSLVVSCSQTVPTTDVTTTSIVTTVSTPVIIPSGGKVIVTDTISITCSTSNSIILYTLDGTDPTTSSTIYTGPFKVPEGSIVVKAMGYQAGAHNSAIATAAFTCSMPVNRWIFDSKWKIVKTAYVPSSKSLTSDSAIAEEVAAYNETSTTDQYFLETSEVPITLAPDAVVWIVKPNTYERVEGYAGITVDRSLVDGRAWAWELDARSVNGLLYIDKTPPDVVVYNPPVDTRPDYEKYAIYEVSIATGAIICEEHCADWQSAGYSSIKEYYNIRLAAFNGDAYGSTTIKVITGVIYTPPSE
jgi:hypothetical protein